MTEEAGADKTPDPPQDPPKPVTSEEFDAVDFEAAIADATKVEPHQFWNHYATLSRGADANQEHGAARVYALLSGICGIHLKTEDRAEPWGPMFVTGDQRSVIPSDLKGEQSATLLAIVDRIKNPGLRARIADIAWTNDRKAAGRAAGVAVAAYRICADGLLDGTFTPYVNENRASFETLKNVQRAFAIAQATTKKDSKGRALFSDELKATALKLYAAAKDDKEYVIFAHTSELALHYELIEQSVIAKDAEELAATAPENAYAMAVKRLWQLAAQMHRNTNSKDGEQRCLFESVKQTLEMRKQVGSAGAEAYWVNRALLELRHIEGQEELEDKLLLELRRLQRASTKEMTPFLIPLDLTEMREHSDELFGSIDLSEALFEFALIAKSIPIEQLKQEARDQLRDFPLANMLSASHIDNEGKPVATSPSAETDGKHSDEWYRHQALQSENVRRHQLVGGYIDSARTTIHMRFGITERHIEPIIYRSPLVPPSHAAIVTLGVTRFFQGDYMSASHLLILQLEPCLRHILKLNGHDPVQRFDDGTEEEFDINKMFTRMRPELAAIFGEDLLYEMDLLFVGRPGPSLRNDLAHGQISAAACFHPNMVYGCWFIFKLCVGFLLSLWKHIAPEIEAAI